MKKQLIATIVAAILSVPVAAQNVILQNEYIKAGVNESTGTLGSGGNTNPGIQYDNAGTSTFNSAYDYLTPGSPYEGWAVRIDNTDGTKYKLYGNNNAGFQSDGNTAVTGAWVGTPTAASAVWAGTATEFGIRHTYSLPSAQRYLDITTRIEATAAMPHMYFGRYIDPDAVAAPGDSSATDNVRGYGIIPKTNVVFSEATVSRYALGLYSAQVGTVNTSIQGWTSDPKNYYLNTDGRADVSTGDDTIGIAFYAANVAVGDILTYNYAYIFGPSAFTAADYAITGGAGGGTAGTSSFGTLVDVGSATDAGSGTTTPPAPPVTSTSVSTTTVSNDVSSTTTIGTPVVTTAVTTPVDSRSGLESVKTTVSTVTTTTPVTVTTTTTPIETVTVVTSYSDSSPSTSTTTTGVSSTLPVVVSTTVTDTVSVTATSTTLTDAINTSLPVITAKLAHHEASEGNGKQTIARETTTNVTTPINKITRVTVTTDGTVVSDTATTVLVNNVDTSVANDSFSGRVDQMSYLNNLNRQLDRGLNMDAFRTDGYTDQEKKITMYVNASGARSNMGDGYNAKSQIYGLGVEKEIKPNWRLGAQYNRVNTTMDGTDSKTAQDKDHVGLFSVYTADNDVKIVNNLGYANNTVKGNRTIENVFNNSHAAKGENVWLNNRIYAPETKGFRPYAGVTVGRSTVGGYTEAGDIQSARTVAKTTDNYTFGEAGVRYEKAIDKLRLIGDVGTTTDSVTTGAATVAYSPTKNGTIALTAATQHSNNINTNTVSLRGIIKF